ncbi:MAG: ATPase, T2SS/T4P/T4SS family [Patescibacteria group bacterium]|nr:ATPase, T2SS/T4P/T4SS family [Patescibacteria group bacterium]
MPAVDELYLTELINDAIRNEASSIYFDISNYPVIKSSGKLNKISTRDVLTKDFLETMKGFFLSDEQTNELEIKKEITIGYDWSSDMRLTVNFFYQKESLSVVIDLIPLNTKELKDLNLPSIVSNILNLNSGLVLVCGPIGSGRTTTIISILQTINKTRDKRILTIEDPIEYEFINDKSIIQQREVKKDVSSIEDGISQSMDEAVDILFISKISTSRQIKLALESASSGKLVFAIMDFDSINTVIEKMFASFSSSQKDLGRTLVSESLKVVINQRLLQKVGGGRILAAEVFVMNSSGKTIVKAGRLEQLKSVMQTSRNDNMQDLNSVLKFFVQKGVIKPEEAEKYLI